MLQRKTSSLWCGKIYDVGYKHVCPLLCRETLSLSSKAICYTNILEKIGWNKRSISALVIRGIEMWENHRYYLLTMSSWLKSHMGKPRVSMGGDNKGHGYREAWFINYYSNLWHHSIQQFTSRYKIFSHISTRRHVHLLQHFFVQVKYWILFKSSS